MHDYWLLLCAIPFLAATFYLLQEQVTLRRRGLRTIGVVVDVRKEKGDGEGGTTFKPIVQFTTTDGQQILWTHSSSAGWRSNTLGKPWPIIYDPRNPQHAIRDHWEGYIAIIIFFAASIFLVISSMH